MVAGQSNVHERKSSQLCPQKTLIKHPRLLSIEGIVNHSEIQHYALSFPTQKGSKGSVELNSHFILRVVDLLKPHAAEYEKWQNEEDSKQHSNQPAAIAAFARLGACNCDIGLGDHLRPHIHWHHGIHRHLAYLRWVDLHVGHLDWSPHLHHWSTNDLGLVEASDNVDLAALKPINSSNQSRRGN